MSRLGDSNKIFTTSAYDSKRESKDGRIRVATGTLHQIKFFHCEMSAFDPKRTLKDLIERNQSIQSQQESGRL